MLLDILGFAALLGGILLPLLPLNRLEKYRVPKKALRKQKLLISAFAVDEDGNLVENV